MVGYTPQQLKPQRKILWYPLYRRLARLMTSALVGGEWSATHPSNFNLKERFSGTHCIEGWLGSRIGLDNVEKREISPLPRLKL
jgi:hypothetical protein